MRGVALAALALVAPGLVPGLAPGLAHAACTNDLPGRGVLNVYADATTAEGVVGGIGANQCGLEVTEFCANGRCLAFFDGLSGYIDVTGLASGTIAPAPARFDYQVSALDGTLSFMGRTQPFEMSTSAPLRVTPAADHVVLSLPDPLPKDIRLTSTGSSGWEGVLPDWAGVPIPVTVYLDRLSAPEATLELFAEDPLLKMDMRLRLARVGDVPTPGSAPAVQDPTPAEPSACDQTYAAAVAVGAGQDRAQIDSFYAAVAAVGITDWDARTAAQCADLLVALAAAGVPVASSNAVAPVPQASCEALTADLRPILRGPDSAEKRAVLAAMVSLGITSIDVTNPKHCAEISAALGR